MSGFSADWLALREPFDRAARAAASASFDWAALRRQLAVGGTPCVLDLACGTGANLRELATRLGGAQRWLLVDHDPALLDAVPDALAAWAVGRGLQCETGPARLRLFDDSLQIEVERRCLDLAGRLDTLPWNEIRLVTASALLDLVSAPWLQALVEHCRTAGAGVLSALSIDGRIEWSPGDPDDAAVQALFRAHQRRDKGFGPALGDAAPTRAADMLAAAGYRISEAASDWRVDGARSDADIDLLRAMVDGIAQAATEQEPAQWAKVAAWRARRLAGAAATGLRVGHRDLLALG